MNNDLFKKFEKAEQRRIGLIRIPNHEPTNGTLTKWKAIFKSNDEELVCLNLNKYVDFQKTVQHIEAIFETTVTELKLIPLF